MANLVKSEPRRELENLRSGIDRVFADAFLRNWPFSGAETTMPGIDLYEQEDKFIVLLDLPGVSKGKVDVNATVDTLTVSGETEMPDEGDILMQERFAGRFYRQIKLPTNIVKDQISAALKNGVMRIVMPKAEESRPKSVKINAVEE